jgi:diguanylate cyclase (GGDEF)-like protein/PAS domain S-box-containing protein
MPTADGGARARILIADDEPQIRLILNALLCVDYDCREVGSAEEALELLAAERFDLVLSDIMMPGLSGLDMIPRVREIAPDTVVVMISGEQTIESAVRAMRAGAFDYVTKPFALDHVEAAVRRALEHHALLASQRHYENFLEEIVRERTDELDKTHRTLATVINASPLALFALDAGGRVTMWNPAAACMFGGGAGGSAEGAPPLLPEGEDGGRPAWLEAARRGVPLSGHEARCRKGDGSVMDVSVWASPLEGAAGGVMFVVADITERRAAEARINYLAYYDTLTGLPKRTLFEDRLTHRLAAGRRRGGMPVVMFVALDRFKKYNDTLGHAAGDKLLGMVAERLRGQAGEGDTVARFEGAEFALLLTSVAGTEAAAAAARRVQQALEVPFRLEGHELYVTASIGLGLHPHDGADARSLLQNAAAALYRAKRQGGNSYQFYAADMNEQAVRHLALENSLRRALNRGDFVLHYQPKVAGDSEQIVGAEALVRWRHEELGVIPPAEFIPLAEDTGLIAPLGEWVLRAALAQSRLWQDAGIALPQVSVNLSLRQFQQPDLVGLIDRVLREAGLAPGCLELELTESFIMHDTACAIATLRELKEMGVRIAIDDFGSGYSSLSYLKQLPIDVLKIDKSFVRDMTRDANDAAIVMAIITLAHSLNLKVVAEGVETEEQLRLLRLLRCDAMQGYLFSRPLPAEDFERLLLRGGQPGADAGVLVPRAQALLKGSGQGGTHAYQPGGNGR